MMKEAGGRPIVFDNIWRNRKKNLKNRWAYWYLTLDNLKNQFTDISQALKCEVVTEKLGYKSRVQDGYWKFSHHNTNEIVFSKRISW